MWWFWTKILANTRKATTITHTSSQHSLSLVHMTQCHAISFSSFFFCCCYLFYIVLVEYSIRLYFCFQIILLCYILWIEYSNFLTQEISMCLFKYYVLTLCQWKFLFMTQRHTVLMVFNFSLFHMKKKWTHSLMIAYV